VNVLHERYPQHGLGTLCGLFGYSRQAYYKYVSGNEYKENAIIPLVLESVGRYREKAPRMGSLKLYHLIRELFQGERIPGRDAFFNLLHENGFVLRKRKTRKTTNSRHRFHKYGNLVKGFDPTAPNQLWVSDITYLETEDGVCYLSLITDACSHKIVGWAVGESLEAIHPVNALNMALECFEGKGVPQGLIHHSDRGVQYCCNQYVGILQENDISISMTQSGDPLENAIAERVNGILKSEWLYDLKMKDINDCRKELSRIITFYNEERPHMSIDMCTPSKAHLMDEKLPSKWKKDGKDRPEKGEKDLLLQNPGSNGD
jgi:putative transposase